MNLRLTLAGLTALALLAGCSSSGAPAVSVPPPVDVGTFTGVSSHSITYYLSGSARSADLTLQLGPGGESQQQQGVQVPLMNRNGDPGLSFDASNGDFLYISAQNNGGGSLTCRITEDGVNVAVQTSRGQYAIVTCSGSA